MSPMVFELEVMLVTKLLIIPDIGRGYVRNDLGELEKLFTPHKSLDLRGQ